MRFNLLFPIILIAQMALANMASPIIEGTSAGSAFTSRDIDILKENITVTTDPQFHSARFQIEYTINADRAGMQIPLLFFAKDYKENFTVWLDDVIIAVTDIPTQYTHTANSPFENFADAFGMHSNSDNQQNITIYLEENIGNVYALNDLKYFEADISEGIHTIRVEYIANVWTDISDWVKEYSFRYSLSPAQYWKSFGSLQIVVHQSEPAKNLTTNLGVPREGKFGTTATWTFSALPGAYFTINYTPPISSFAHTLIKIGPSGIATIFGLLCIGLHLIFINRYRRNNIRKKYSWVVITGSLVIPLLIIISYIISFDIIDNVIGNEAGDYHGYTFLVIIIYPFVAAIYWLVSWFIDKQIKRNILQNKKS